MMKLTIFISLSLLGASLTGIAVAQFNAGGHWQALMPASAAAFVFFLALDCLTLSCRNWLAIRIAWLGVRLTKVAAWMVR